jgi:hypothetical protein
MDHAITKYSFAALTNPGSYESHSSIKNITNLNGYNDKDPEPKNLVKPDLYFRKFFENGGPEYVLGRTIPSCITEFWMGIFRKHSRFSLWRERGRCPACGGGGSISISTRLPVHGLVLG